MRSETGKEAMRSAIISRLPLWASGVRTNWGPSKSNSQNGHLEQTSGVCVINVHLSVVEECPRAITANHSALPSLKAKSTPSLR